MKKTILAATIAALSFSTSAESFEEQRDTLVLELCKTRGDIATSIMTLRQTGLASAYDIMHDEHGNARGEETILLTAAAFDEPLWRSAQYKEEAAIEFGINVQTECLNEHLFFARAN